MNADLLDGRELPLFPLQAVLFPGGLLGLKVFEARYLDLTSSCLRDREPFGVVALRSGREVRDGHAAVNFEAIGTLAEIVSADSDRPGILQLRCRGTQRFHVVASHQQPDGLWLARARAVPDDDALAPTAALIGTVRALGTMIAQLKAQGESPLPQPYRFDDAGWVANRWCEILPISQAAKQKLMELPDPMLRLQLVDDYLRGKGVVS